MYVTDNGLRGEIGNGSSPNGKNRGDEQSWNHWATLSDMSSDITLVAGWECGGWGEWGWGGIRIQTRDAALTSQVFLGCLERWRQKKADCSWVPVWFPACFFLNSRTTRTCVYCAAFCFLWQSNRSITVYTSFFFLSACSLSLLPLPATFYHLHSWGTVTASLNDNNPSS